MNFEPTFSEGNVIENTNKGLIPILDEDYSPLAIPLPESSFIPPLSKDLSLLEEQVTLDDKGEIIDNNLHFDQPILASDSEESVSFIYNSAGDIIGAKGVAADISGLDFVGGFGDYNGGNDVTFTVKDNQNKVIETFSMTGAGEGALYKFADKEYLLFSGTNETTKVNVSAISDLVLEDYTGDSLSVETAGSITARNITLNDENTEENSGLTLRAGIDTENSISNVFDKYSVIDFYDREMVDINNYVEIVGNDDSSGRDEFFFYDTQNLYYLPGYYSSRAFGINDNTQMIGEGLPTANDTKYIPFVAYGDGSTQEIVYGGNGGRFPNQPTDITYTYIPQGHLRDINNYFETAYYQLNTPPANTPPGITLTPFEDAYFNAPTGGRSQTVNIGYSLLNSDKSKVFGINDQRQVVGIYRQTVASNQSYIDRAFAFDYLSNSVTNLGTLPGGNYSAAYEINDQGQIVGVSTSSSGSRAFIYENGVMKDMGIPYTGDPTKRDGIDINNVGQAVVTSSAGEPLIYQDGVVTNVNDWLIPEVVSEGYTVTEAKGINDLGYIIAQGTKSDGVNHGFLLVPTFKKVNRNINVGNISTFGETVLLEGAEVYLEGQSIVTQGGKIESNGKTIVNSNLVIDSSITDEYVGNPNADSVISQSGVKVAGGDVLFTDTVNTNSTGDQNLTLKAGAGDIAFKNTVGDTNPVFNLTVEGAGSLTTTGKDLTVDNELKLEVINDIATANISAQGLSDISLGTIGKESFASSGNFATGNIEALSLEVSNNGNFTAGNITTSNGDLDVISLNQLTVGQLTATKGGISLISGTKGIKVGGTVKGDNGFIALAQLDIVTNQITSSEDAVILKSSQGAVTVNGSVTAFDEISLAAAGNVTVGAVTSNDQSVALFSATGVVNYSGAVLGTEDVTIASAKSLTIDQKIRAKFGSTALVSTEGSVTTNAKIDSGLELNISAKQNVDIRTIRTYDGNIIVNAEQGTAIIRSAIRSGGGDVSISALGKVSTGNIISQSGKVSVVSDLDLVRTGYIRTDQDNRSGNVYLEAGRDIKISSTVPGTPYHIYAGEEGVISIVDKNKQKSKFLIDEPTELKPYPLPVPIPTTPGGGTPTPKPSLIPLIIEIFKFIDAGPTAPAHQDEINPITGQPYVDVEEFEFVKAFIKTSTEEQKSTVTKVWNTPKYGIAEQGTMDELAEYGEEDEQGRRCIGFPLPFHLGSEESFGRLHNIYATHVTGSPGDFLLIPPLPIALSSDPMLPTYSYAIYDGKAQPGSIATKPTVYYPNSGSALDILRAEPAYSLAEVKTGHDFLNRIYIGNPLPARGKDIPSDMERLDRLATQVNKEAFIAKICQDNYFVSFDNGNAARAAAQVLTPKILPSFDVKFHAIKAPYNYY